MLKNFSSSTKGFIAGLVVMAVLAIGFSAVTADSTNTSTSSESAIDAIDAESRVDGSLGSDEQVAAGGSFEETDEVDEAPVQDNEPSIRFSSLPTIAAGDLPIEALDTLDLIADNGPYPFSQDDGVFQNREGILPDQQRGYYREYTVITLSSDDRGARRIVAGEDGDLYYTSDHYYSFEEIVW